jgi:DNA primase
MRDHAAGEFEVGGRRLRVRNLARVVFPRAGTTKAQLLGYYVAVSEVMLPHKPLSRQIAELLEAQSPDAVVSRMARWLRAGRVLVDWRSSCRSATARASQR